MSRPFVVVHQPHVVPVAARLVLPGHPAVSWSVGVCWSVGSCAVILLSLHGRTTAGKTRLRPSGRDRWGHRRAARFKAPVDGP